MKLPTILHLNDRISDESGPFENARYINRTDFEVIICSYYDKNQDLIPFADETGMEIIGLGARNLLDFGAWYRLLKIIKNKKVDIIHTHHHRTGLLGRLLGNLRSDVKVIHSFGSIYNKFSWYSRLGHILTTPFVDSFICVSKSVENSFGRFEEKLLKNKKIVIYNGIDIFEVDREKRNRTQREKMGIKRDEYLIGNVARLIALKDQKTLIQGVAEVIKANPKVKLVIIGKGKLEKELKYLALKLDIENNVIFTGFVERKRVYRILHSLDLFIMTSLWEGFCVAVLQAMATGIPTILTKINSFQETIVDGVSGKLIPIKNPIMLAEAIKEMINNPKMAKKMAELARKRVIENFSLQKTAANYEKFYNQLLNEKKTAKIA